MKVQNILIVDQNNLRSASSVSSLGKAGIAENIKAAVNGDHALLCIDHLELYGRIKGNKLIILINLDYFGANLNHFLDSFKNKRYLNRENSIIIAIKNSSSVEEVEKARLKGITEFISSAESIIDLNEIIARVFAAKPRENEKAKAGKKLVNQTMSMN
ncbi:MAG: hypothetical protein K2X86_07610 [Cytophagaceae bacterium]|nr:hypothetical protein [Cytophagaceae bacterium]